MTDEQKAVFCDEYCKYRERADKVAKCVKDKPDSKILQYVLEGAQTALTGICEKCPLSEVKNE